MKLSLKILLGYIFMLAIIMGMVSIVIYERRRIKTLNLSWLKCFKFGIMLIPSIKTSLNFPSWEKALWGGTMQITIVTTLNACTQTVCYEL